MPERVPPTARPSATIVVVRDASAAPEILLVRRRAGDAFGDSYAFPGGIIDADESVAHPFCSGLSAEQADAILHLPSGALDYYSAAIRELFEETGILLARDAHGKWADAYAATNKLRQRVDKGRLPWSRFLREHGLCMAGDALHYFAYWETPYCRPKRWTTRFFMAELPPGQVASHDGSEVTDSRWLSAAAALALGQGDELPMPFPTLTILKDLAQFASLQEMLDWARRRPETAIDMIRPVLLQGDGAARIVIPGDPDYPGEQILER